MVLGLGVGVVEGIYDRSFRKIRNGLIGGATGGLIGGLLFDWIYNLELTASGRSSRAAAFVVLGLIDRGGHRAGARRLSRRLAHRCRRLSHRPPVEPHPTGYHPGSRRSPAAALPWPDEQGSGRRASDHSPHARRQLLPGRQSLEAWHAVEQSGCCRSDAVEGRRHHPPGNEPCAVQRAAAPRREDGAGGHDRCSTTARPAASASTRPEFRRQGIFAGGQAMECHAEATSSSAVTTRTAAASTATVRRGLQNKANRQEDAVEWAE